MNRIPKWSDDLIGRVVWHESYKERGIITGPVYEHRDDKGRIRYTCDTIDGGFEGDELQLSESKGMVRLGGEDTSYARELAEMEVLDPPDKTCRTCKHLVVSADCSHPYHCGLIGSYWADTTGPNAKLIHHDETGNGIDVTTDFGCKLHKEKKKPPTENQ